MDSLASMHEICNIYLYEYSLLAAQETYASRSHVNAEIYEFYISKWGTSWAHIYREQGVMVWIRA